MSFNPVEGIGVMERAVELTNSGESFVMATVAKVLPLDNLDHGQSLPTMESSSDGLAEHVPSQFLSVKRRR
jgi:hypothetical protein